MASMTGYVVRTTDAAVAFVAESDAAKAGVKPMWIPRKKIETIAELDALSCSINTAQDGERVGIPMAIWVDDAFLAKIVGA